MMGSSGDETCDIGEEYGSPVSSDYAPRGNEFRGEVNWVQIDLGLDDQSHMSTPEQRPSLAMARQQTVSSQIWRRPVGLGLRRERVGKYHQ